MAFTIVQIHDNQKIIQNDPDKDAGNILIKDIQ